MATAVPGIQLSVVIPAYDEEARLPAMLADALPHLQARFRTFEILVVDDGSTDGTRALCAMLAHGLPQLRPLGTPRNRGKGHAVRVGVLAARGDLVLVCDADGSTPMRQLDRLVAALDDGRAGVAIGSRRLDGADASGQPPWRRAWSQLAHVLVQRSLVPGVADAFCGFKLWTRQAALDVFSRASVDGWAFDLETLALAQRLGHAIAEVPVTWTDDARSRVRPARDLPRVLGETIGIALRLPPAR